jgi:hypothetical protein
MLPLTAVNVSLGKIDVVFLAIRCGEILPGSYPTRVLPEWDKSMWSGILSGVELGVIQCDSCNNS